MIIKYKKETIQGIYKCNDCHLIVWLNKSIRLINLDKSHQEIKKISLI